MHVGTGAVCQDPFPQVTDKNLDVLVVRARHFAITQG